MVATIAPMKSGLKVGNLGVGVQMLKLVATIAAMKSGLKGGYDEWNTITRYGSNHCRDEKRTERLSLVSVSIISPW